MMLPDARLHHLRKRRPRKVEGCVQVNAHDEPPLLVGELRQGLVRTNGGVVHKHAHRPQRCRHLVHHPVHLLRVRDVGEDGVSAASPVLNELGNFLDVRAVLQAVDGYARALVGESQRNRLADVAARPGDQCHLALKFQCSLHCSLANARPIMTPAGQGLKARPLPSLIASKARMKGVFATVFGVDFVFSQIDSSSGKVAVRYAVDLGIDSCTQQAMKTSRERRRRRPYTLATVDSALVRETLITPLMPSSRVKRRLSWETPVV